MSHQQPEQTFCTTNKHEIGNKFEDILCSLKNEYRHLEEKVSQYAQEKPLHALGFSLLTGLILSELL